MQQMRILYEGRDVTADVRCSGAELIDRYGSVPDEMSLTFWDESGIWAAWNPQQGQRLQVIADGFDTGEQRIDHIEIDGRNCRLRAISAAASVRSEGWSAMNQVRLLEIARRCALETGLALKTYGLADDPLYERVSRGHLTPLVWLVERCELEGVAVKVDDKRLLLIDRKWAQRQEEALELELSETTAEAESRAWDVTGSVTLLCGGMRAEAARGNVGEGGGREFVRNDVAFYTLGEGKRYAQNLLDSKIRTERVMKRHVTFNPGLAALGVVRVLGAEAVEGLWTIKSVTHCPMEDKSKLVLEAVP